MVSAEVVFVDLRDLFDGLEAGASIALAEAISDRLAASETAVRVCNELDEIVADKLLAAALR
jgi:hypothetical protein